MNTIKINQISVVRLWLWIILGGGDSGGGDNSKLFPSAVQESHNHVQCLDNAQTKLKSSMSQL